MISAPASQTRIDAGGRLAMYLTQHASLRAQQRALSAEDLRLILAWGEESHDGHGAVILRLTARALARLFREAGTTMAVRAEALRRAYCVEALDGGAILTCGWRHRRLRRN